jgi:transposase-like protein
MRSITKYLRVGPKGATRPPMASTKRHKPGVRTRDGGEYTCPGCGAVYQVTVYTSPFKDTNHQDCDICNMSIKSWNHATTWWSYKLTKRPRK